MDCAEVNVYLSMGFDLESDDKPVAAFTHESESSGLTMFSKEASGTGNCNIQAEMSFVNGQSPECYGTQERPASQDVSPEIEAIVGCSRYQGQIIFQVRVKNEPHLKAVLSSFMNRKYPQKVIKYYESRITRKLRQPYADTEFDKDMENKSPERNEVESTTSAASNDSFPIAENVPEQENHKIGNVCVSNGSSVFGPEVSCDKEFERPGMPRKPIDPSILDLMERMKSDVCKPATEFSQICSMDSEKSRQSATLTQVASLAEFKRRTFQTFEDLQHATEASKAIYAEQIRCPSHSDLDDLSETNISFCSDESHIGSSEGSNQPMDTSKIQLPNQTELGNYMFAGEESADICNDEIDLTKQPDPISSTRVAAAAAAAAAAADYYMKSNSRNQLSSIYETEDEPKIERVLSCCRHEGQLLFLVKLKDRTSHVAVPASYANYACPQKVIKYYQSRMGWSS